MVINFIKKIYFQKKLKVCFTKMEFDTFDPIIVLFLGLVDQVEGK